MAKDTTLDTPAPGPAPALSAEQFAQLLQVVAQNKQTLDADALATILRETAEGTAKAMQRAMKPENQTHPGKSVFSHPDGDQVMPKPPLPYELYWNGYPVHKFPETETWREWLLQSNMPPAGEYTVVRNDASRMKVTIASERDVNGKPTKVMVTFPVPRADKDKIPPKTVLIAQMLDPTHAKTAFIKAMTEQLTEMFGEA